MMHVRLPFYGEAQRDVERDNSLIVLGKGLGMVNVLASFVANHVRPGKLIVGVNISKTAATELVWPALVDAMDSKPQGHPALLLPRFVSSEYSVKDRKELYEVGGFVVVTANVLVHDFLHNAIPAHLIDGLVILNADAVKEGSNEHFAVKLFRMRNQVGFIKAFSENPQALVKGFHTCEKVMRMLYVSRLCLWPRFHKSIKMSLKDHAPDLVDLSVNLSDKMEALMRALRETIARVLEELKISTRTIDFSDVHQTVKDKGKVLAPFFDEVIRRQIQGVAEKVGWKVHSLVADLACLRGLLWDVLEMNAVHFYQKVITIAHASPRGSNWVMRKEAQRALQIARSRVWLKTLSRSRSTSRSITPEIGAKLETFEHETTFKGPAQEAENVEPENADAGVDKTVVTISATLEPSPKWDALCSVLDEIHEDIEAAGPDADVKRIIILARDKQTVREIQHVLVDGADAYLQSIFRQTFPSIATQVDESQARREQQSLHQLTMTQIARNETSSTGQKPLERKRPPLKSSKSSHSRKKTRRKVSEGRALVSEVAAAISKNNAEAEEDSLGAILDGETSSKQQTLVWHAEWVDVQGRTYRILEDFRPSFIVLFNADISLIRQVELYKASNHGLPVRLYILSYADFLEEERFSSAVDREKHAFKSLIRERATMTIHADQEGRQKEVEFMTQALDVSQARTFLPVIRDSRLEDLEKKNGPGKIIVDTRELRSTLPMLLYQSMMKIVPITLEVGDFILSSKIAVERKSVPDLHGSFGSGRLFNQAEALCLHYRHPCLLIELEADKPLSLSSTSGGVPPEISATSIVSKMVLLMQQFPSLRLLWAKGPRDAVALFSSLKAREDEPDEEAAAKLGVDTAEDADTEFNAGPKALLRNLPGVDGHNMAAIMRKVKNVSSLLMMSRKEMGEILGSSSKGNMLYDFVNEKPSEALAAL